jgi:hypothetical protein
MFLYLLYFQSREASYATWGGGIFTSGVCKQLIQRILNITEMKATIRLPQKYHKCSLDALLAAAGHHHAARTPRGVGAHAFRGAERPEGTRFDPFQFQRKSIPCSMSQSLVLVNHVHRFKSPVVNLLF